MVNPKVEGDRKSVQLNISVSPYLKKRLEELVERGLFSNVSDAVRYAIMKLLAEVEAQEISRKKIEKDKEKRWIKTNEGIID